MDVVTVHRSTNLMSHGFSKHLRLYIHCIICHAVDIHENSMHDYNMKTLYNGITAPHSHNYIEQITHNHLTQHQNDNNKK